MKAILFFALIALSTQAQAEYSVGTIDRVNDYCDFLFSDLQEQENFTDEVNMAVAPEQQNLCLLALNEIPASEDLAFDLPPKAFSWFTQHKPKASNRPTGQINTTLPSFLGRVPVDFDPKAVVIPSLD